MPAKELLQEKERSTQVIVFCSKVVDLGFRRKRR